MVSMRWLIKKVIEPNFEPNNSINSINLAIIGQLYQSRNSDKTFIYGSLRQISKLRKNNKNHDLKLRNRVRRFDSC